MKTTTILPLALSMLLAACTANTDPGDGTQAPQTGSSGTEPPTPAGSAPEYAISCHGDVTKKSLDTSVSPRCVGGAPGTKCGDPCAAQAIEIRYVPPATRCGSVDRFVWDGTTCKKYLTNDGGEMRCTGADCERLFTSESDCKAAYEACLR
jgi:hypothetical protein